MSRDFEELDFRETPLGDLTLRRRRLLSLGDLEIFEVKLGDAFLMSSLFHEVEVALADLGLGELESPRLGGGGRWGAGIYRGRRFGTIESGSLLVVEALEPVLTWHRRGMVPLGRKLDRRSALSLLHGDFFSLADSQEGFDSNNPGDNSMRSCSTSIIRPVIS